MVYPFIGDGDDEDDKSIVGEIAGGIAGAIVTIFGIFCCIGFFYCYNFVWY